MITYKSELADIRRLGGRWQAFKMRCFSVYATFETHCLPTHSEARVQKLLKEMGKP